MVRLHGEEVDCKKANVDPMALYASRGVKSHGWLADDSILILCLYNVVIYSYVIYVAGVPCSME
jgi:hypothetical protein